MACTTDFIDFVCSQLNGVGIIRSKKMFGDWLIYIDEKPVILACDNICYVKKLPVIAELMTGADTGFPYDGAKEHYILDIEHRDKAIEIIETLLPAILTLRRKRSETEGRECFVDSLPFFGVLTTIRCCCDNFSTVLRSIQPLLLLVFSAMKLCLGAKLL